MHIKFFGWLSSAVILSYLAVVALGYYMPLQNDEVGELFLHARAFLDNRTLIGLLPQCGKDVFSAPLPLLWYPPAFLNYLTYAQVDNPIGIRIGGILQFAIWMGLWLAIALKLFALPKNRWWAALAILLAILGFDALPLSLLVNRPEQSLLIGIGTPIVLALYADTLSRTALSRIAGTSALFLVVLYAHFIHPKSFAMLPLEAMMATIFLRRAWGNQGVALLGAAAVAFIAIDSYVIDLTLLTCPHSAEVREFLQETFLPVRTLWTDPLTFIVHATKNVLVSAISDFNLEVYFTLSPIWLPFSIAPLNIVTHSLVKILDMEGWLLHLSLLLFACWVGCRYTLRRLKKAGPAEDYTHSGTAWMALIGVLMYVAAIFVFVTEGIYYSVGFMVPLVLLAGMFSLSLVCPGKPWEHPILVKVSLVLLAASACNQLLLLDRYAGLIATPGEYAQLDINHKAFSPTQGYEKIRNDIFSLTSQCHIATDHSASHVVVDDVAYTAMHYTYEPLFFSDSTWICCHHDGKRPSGRPMPDSSLNGSPWFDTPGYMKLLRGYGSDGIIARCVLFPRSLRELATEREGICCIPRSVIDKTD